MFITRVRSIQRKLMRLGLLTSSCALLLACAAFMIFDMMTFRATLVRTLTAQAEIVGINGASALLFGDVPAAVKTLSAVQARASLDRSAIFGKDGRPFAEWRRSAADVEPLPSVPDANETWSRYSPRELELFQPIKLDGGRVGTVYIRSNLSDLVKRGRRYVLITALVFVLSLLTAGAISRNLGGKISEPILSLARTAEKVKTEKNYAVRAETQSQDEIGVLVNTFNEMLDHIEANEAELRQSHSELEARVLDRTRELEASNKELEAFSYSVSHDLRAPLRSIDGFSLAVIEDWGDKIGPDGHNALQRVRAASQQMSKLIDDMINLARITRAPLERQDVDLSAICQRILSSLAELDPERRVAIDVQKGAVVSGDPRLLSAALDNLLGNAWKFTSKQADARITFGEKTVSGGSRAFFVKDNGAGFDMTYANKLFLPFQRLHDAADYKGTGIGLATVHRVITRHGGRIWAESEPGQGATFTFTL